MMGAPGASGGDSAFYFRSGAAGGGVVEQGIATVGLGRLTRLPRGWRGPREAEDLSAAQRPRGRFSDPAVRGAGSSATPAGGQQG